MDPCIVPADGKYYLYYCGGGRITKNGKQVWEFKAYMATSEDGITWLQAPEPPFSARGYLKAVEFDHRLWVLGGIDRHSFLTGSWATLDGETWIKETAESGFPTRWYHNMLTFAGRLWVAR